MSKATIGNAPKLQRPNTRSVKARYPTKGATARVSEWDEEETQEFRGMDKLKDNCKGRGGSGEQLMTSLHNQMREQYSYYLQTTQASFSQINIFNPYRNK